MKYFFILLASALVSLFSLAEVLKETKQETLVEGDIIVYVDNVVEGKGDVYVGLFNSRKTFRKIKKVYRYEILPANNDELIAVIEDVPFDEYAIAIFQDFNMNQKFDENFMGFPKEPFGFSTNFTVKYKAPRYKDVTFQHRHDDTELTIYLQNW